MISLVVVAVLAGCGTVSRTQEVSDVTKAETIILKKKPGQGHVHYLTITGAGALQGTAEINLIENVKPYRTERLSGSVNFQWNGVWYADSAEIRYSPSSVTGGNVRLGYQFKD